MSTELMLTWDAEHLSVRFPFRCRVVRLVIEGLDGDGTPWPFGRRVFKKDERLDLRKYIAESFTDRRGLLVVEEIK